MKRITIHEDEHIDCQTLENQTRSEYTVQFRSLIKIFTRENIEFCIEKYYQKLYISEMNKFVFIDLKNFLKFCLQYIWMFLNNDSIIFNFP